MRTGADSTAEGSVIALPQGGGAVSGVGETFSPDPFTGTGAFSVPIQVLAGRHGVQPHQTLGYSTGNGNGPFGLGWQLSLPGVSRKTSHGVPGYRDIADAEDPDGLPADVFVLSGAEDLVPVLALGSGRVRYRPRTEGLFARIEHVAGDGGDYWEVRTRDGLTTLYGTPRPPGTNGSWRDPAVVADPADPDRIFSWRITQTRDLLGNLVRYEYIPDEGRDDAPDTGRATHRWNQPMLWRISYADYGDRAAPSFLVSVEFDYETRPDPFSDYRPGFELRTTRRCTVIRVSAHAADGVTTVTREHRMSYTQAAFNRVSMLSRIDVVGIDEAGSPDRREQALPPITFEYAEFDPARRRFERLAGVGLPTGSLADPTLALVDLHGCGLLDVLELGPVARRYWRNTGDGRFDLPRTLDEAPPVSLADPGVQIVDADGDGRPDLMVLAGVGSTGTGLSGYFPMSFPAGWSARSFQPYRQVPSVSPGDPQVRMLDVTGDGLTDLVCSGTRLLSFLNDRSPDRAWSTTLASNGAAPQIDLADPRVRVADMTGDGLQDLVLLRSGNITYWPNLGQGHWGAPVAMGGAPRFPDGYDPRRILLGDLDGDGVADLVYVDDGQVVIWGNQTGTAFTDAPITLAGTPTVVDVDDIRLTDLHGTGMAGLLYTRAGDAAASGWRFVDLTGGTKPYLLTSVDNHVGAVTTIAYTSSTVEYLRDEADRATRWRTTLPFPVHVVSRVEVRDSHSGGRLVTDYRYHHGYWDGVEREFRGFACVDQLDAETFDRGPSPSGGGDPGDGPVEHHSPPTLTRTWFHPGPVAAAEAGDWTELDLSGEGWPGDPSMLTRDESVSQMLAGLDRPTRRDALRTLRGHVLRSELYARDETERADRPYTVTESVYGVRREVGWGAAAGTGQPVPAAAPIFLPYLSGSRTTQWERGDQPMTRFTFPAEPDPYGLVPRQLDVAVPRDRDPRLALDPAQVAEPYLATAQATDFAQRDEPDLYVVDRVSRTTSYEVVNDGLPSVPDVRHGVLTGTSVAGLSLRIIGQMHTFYDGDAFIGLPLGELGEHSLITRVETLAFTESFLDDLYTPDPESVSSRPAYLTPGAVDWPSEYPDEFRALLPSLAGYHHHDDTDVPGSAAGFWVQTARHRHDAQPRPGEPARVARGLPVESLDPFDALTRIDYDEYDLLPVAVTDPAGLTTTATYDLRVLQPRQVVDVNGNTTAVTYSPLGLVAERYVRGKDGEGRGDQALPGTVLHYDLLAVAEGRGPVSVTTIRRVHHDTETDVPLADPEETIRSVQFSDGFGRILQTRAQGEDTLFGDPHFGGEVIPADQTMPVGPTCGSTREPGQPDNVVVSGWQLYDNKGRVVVRYEPFYATGYDYVLPSEQQLGQRAVLFYDPRGQLTRTVNPDGSHVLVVPGVPNDMAHPNVFEPSPWLTFTYDPNDNAGRTHPQESEGYANHWNTPTSIEIDALGRTVTAVARNGTAIGEWMPTRIAYDIQGNITTITDALARPAFSYRLDLLKRRWRMDSIDAGRRDSVPNAAGQVIEVRDSKGAVILTGYDRLRRHTRVWGRDNGNTPLTLRQRMEYGDAGDAGQDEGARADARARNLLGRTARAYDEAGLVIPAAFDFKGNPLSTTRYVIADSPILDTYEAAATNNWVVAPFTVDWTPGAGQKQDQRDAELLDPRAFTHDSVYDALDRVVRHTLPTDDTGHRSVLVPAYTRAGALDSVTLDGNPYVQHIAFDAKGQRSLIAYGNGVMTRYAYDQHTLRLARLRSEPYTFDGDTYHAIGEVLQDIGYGYDLVGNILAIHDRTPGCGVPPALDLLDREFAYDPVYRLLTATGREQQSPVGGDPWLDVPRASDPTSTQRYAESYVYDAVGNLLQLAHRPSATHLTSGYTRTFSTAPGTNQLRRMESGSLPFDYHCDANGNVTSEAAVRHFTWNHVDRLATFAIQTPGAEPSVHVQYLYDGTGERVVKLTRRQGGLVEIVRYIGRFEQHRWADGSNNHVHVMDDQRRIAMVRSGPAHPDDRGPAVSYQLTDHLGSAVATLDGSGMVTNREEYTPYGETAFGSFTMKRYRFTGNERDEESGWAYHSARYYSPIICRWARCDPLAPRAGVNAFIYCFGNPLRATDVRGREPAAESDAAAGLFSGYPIYPGGVNILLRHFEYEPQRRGDVSLPDVVTDVGFRIVNRSGLRSFIEDRTSGGLTDFEKTIVANWGKDDTAVLTPILRPGRGIVAYQLDSSHPRLLRNQGEMGIRESLVYTRTGELVYHHATGGDVESEGLGPAEYIVGALWVKGVLKWIFNRTVGRLWARYTAKKLIEGEVGEVSSSKAAEGPVAQKAPKELDRALKRALNADPEPISDPRPMASGAPITPAPEGLPAAGTTVPPQAPIVVVEPPPTDPLAPDPPPKPGAN